MTLLVAVTMNSQSHTYFDAGDAKVSPHWMLCVSVASISMELVVEFTDVNVKEAVTVEESPVFLILARNVPEERST